MTSSDYSTEQTVGVEGHDNLQDYGTDKCNLGGLLGGDAGSDASVYNGEALEYRCVTCCLPDRT